MDFLCGDDKTVVAHILRRYVQCRTGSTHDTFPEEMCSAGTIQEVIQGREKGVIPPDALLT